VHEVPIFVPPLRCRVSELPRIVEAYAVDAVETIAALVAPVRAQDSCFFTGDDLQWVVECMATSLPEIEKATLRIVALRMSANLSVAAERLGIAPVSLARWLDRRPRPWARKAGRFRSPRRSPKQARPA